MIAVLKIGYEMDARGSRLRHTRDGWHKTSLGGRPLRIPDLNGAIVFPFPLSVPSKIRAPVGPEMFLVTARMTSMKDRLAAREAGVHLRELFVATPTP